MKLPSANQNPKAYPENRLVLPLADGYRPARTEVMAAASPAGPAPAISMGALGLLFFFLSVINKFSPI